MKARPPECQHCHKPFTPDPHNAWHQNFCYARECRAASKRHSQWKWLKKNVAANCGTENMGRVHDWRKEHPKSSKRRKPHQEVYITAIVTETSPEKQSISFRIEDRYRGALQDFVFSKQPASTEIALVLTSALQGFVHVAPGKQYLVHRFRGKPGSNGGRRACERLPSRESRRQKGGKSRWKLLNRMATGKRLPYHTLRRLIHAVAENAGMPVNVTAHTFRRSCATELLRCGANMYHVKELLCHESLETLKHYAKLTITDLKATHAKCHPRERDGRNL